MKTRTRRQALQTGRWIPAVLLLLVFSCACPLWAEEQQPAPSDLSSSGVAHQIRNIYIETYDVFDPRIDDYQSWPFRFLNTLHIKTSDSFIRRELLLKEGMQFDQDLMEESERNLRKYSFLTDVKVRSEVVGPNLVDVFVHTEDQWTTEVNVSAGKSAGFTTYDFDIQEANFLGYGKRVGLSYNENPERSTYGFHLADPQFFNTRWTYNTDIEKSSDGWRYVTDAIHPFYSMDTKWAYGLSWDSGTYTKPLYSSGKSAAEIDTDHRDALLFAAHSWGERYDKKKFGVLFNADNLRYPRPARITWPEGTTLKPSIKKNLHPEDRDSYEYGGIFKWDHERFIEETYIDNFGQIEDLPVGLAFGAVLTKSENVTSNPNFFELHTMAQYGKRFNDAQYLTLYGEVLGRKPIGAGGFRNVIFNGYAHYYLQTQNLKLARITFPQQTFAANVSATLTSNVEAPFQISLGENEGLRGYTFKSFTGENRLLMNIEDRIFTPLDYRLFAIGVAGFVDSGYVWSSEDHLRFDDFGLTAGFGLRIGLKKSQSSRVVRVDFAVPIHQNFDNLGFTQTRGWSISVSSSQIFNVLGDIPRIFQLF